MMHKAWYLGVDPGKGLDDTIGLAVADAKGDMLFMGQFTFSEAIEWLEHPHSATEEFLLDLCNGAIMEDYRIFKHKAKAHIGKRVYAAETIGMIRTWATRHNITLERQGSDILKPASMLFNIDYFNLPHDISHQFAAVLHLKYWLYTVKKIGETFLMEQQREATQNG